MIQSNRTCSFILHLTLYALFWVNDKTIINHTLKISHIDKAADVSFFADHL